MADQKQRRQHTRVASDISVTVRDKRGQQSEAGRIRNVSLGGVFIEMEPKPFGAELDLTFSLPQGSGNIRCAAYVAWSTKTNPERSKIRGNGLRLTDISVSDMRLLSEFIHGELDSG